jgi:uncharacterized SAM-binding protein YcdF (DUF218 family)
MTSPAASPGRKRRRWILLVILTLFLLVLAHAGVTYLRIRAQSLTDETRPAAAIVVFGAAEYAGRPSPVYRARLDHALALYQRGIAPVIIVTGGHGNDPKFSEGGVGRDYLKAGGVPEERLIAETQGENTVQSAARVAAIMRANGMPDCVAVSDGYHIFRVKQMLEDHGITVYGAPRPQLRANTRTQRIKITLREVLSYSLWKLGVTGWLQ